ncbi:hypothetical protein SAMN05444747_111103 [Variovorax sp. OV329]|nr:hypothetical protein SAMN05444747_111103 [Variovorax sp. OV329]
MRGRWRPMPPRGTHPKARPEPSESCCSRRRHGLALLAGIAKSRPWCCDRACRPGQGRHMEVLIRMPTVPMLSADSREVPVRSRLDWWRSAVGEVFNVTPDALASSAGASVSDYPHRLSGAWWRYDKVFLGTVGFRCQPRHAARTPRAGRSAGPLPPHPEAGRRPALRHAWGAPGGASGQDAARPGAPGGVRLRGRLQHSARGAARDARRGLDLPIGPAWRAPAGHIGQPAVDAPAPLVPATSICT